LCWKAADRLDFLRTEYGFAGPEVVPDETGVYPLLRRVRYRRNDLTVEISLVLSYMGEEYVATTLVSGDRSGSVRRTQIGSNTAHTGYQMRRALDRQAEAVRRILHDQMPPGLSTPAAIECGFGAAGARTVGMIMGTEV
jgi:hypothetical protein